MHKLFLNLNLQSVASAYLNLERSDKFMGV